MHCILFFRIVYKEIKENGSNNLEEGRVTPVAIRMSQSRASSIAGNSLSPSTPIPGTPSVSSCTVEDVLQLLRHLFVFTTSNSKAVEYRTLEHNEISSELYFSKKITNKLIQVSNRY